MTSIDAASAEYRAITESCGMLDRSERGKLALTGSEAKSFLQGQVTNDVEALQPGQGCYAAFLTTKGKMVGDLRILDTGAGLLLDTERVALQALFNMISQFSIGYDVQLHKRTLERGLVSLIGPGSRETIGLEASGALARGEHCHEVAEVRGIKVRAVRSDNGVDLLCDSADTDALLAQLEELGAIPVSEVTAECLRVESGRPRYGIDMDDSVIPQEAGLNERAVSFSKGCYVGQETVARLFYRGKPNRHLRGVRLSSPAFTGEEVMLGERVVGHLGSVVQSPRFGPIALALIRREAPPGSIVAVGPGRIEGTVESLPFT